MSNSPDFIDYLHELLAGVPELRMRRMFGGHGVYSGERMFALVDDDALYIKTDDHNRQAFLDEDCTPFTVIMKGQPMEMAYYSVPESALDDADDMLRWARLGIDAALRKPAKKKKPGK